MATAAAEPAPPTLIMICEVVLRRAGESLEERPLLLRSELGGALSAVGQHRRQAEYLSRGGEVYSRSRSLIFVMILI